MKRVSPQEFDAIANQVWRDLLPLISDDLKSHFDKIQIRIENFPSRDVLDDLKGTELAEHPDELCGLHVGVPLTEQSVMAPDLLPTLVYLFRNALIEFSECDGTPAGRARLREEIAITLLHEIGHFFGLSEEDLHRLGFD